MRPIAMSNPPRMPPRHAADGHDDPGRRPPAVVIAPLAPPPAGPAQADDAMVVAMIDRQLARARHLGRPTAVLGVELAAAAGRGAPALVDALGRRLRASVRSNDVVVQLPGCRFAVVLDHCGDVEARAIAARLVGRLRQPYRVDRTLAVPMLRLRHAVALRDGEDGAGLLRTVLA